MAEEWISTCKGTLECFHTTWAAWREHTAATAFVPSNLDVALLKLAYPNFGLPTRFYVEYPFLFFTQWYMPV